MKISRRKFIETTPAALGAVILLDRASAAERSVKGGTPELKPVGDNLSRLTWDSFYPYQNTDFIFTDQNGRSIVLTLVNMTDIKPADFKPRTPGEECFLMTFSGRRNSGAWLQDTYSVDHFALGKFDLFITSGGRRLKADLYNAVINRITG